MDYGQWSRSQRKRKNNNMDTTPRPRPPYSVYEREEAWRDYVLNPPAPGVLVNIAIPDPWESPYLGTTRERRARIRHNLEDTMKRAGDPRLPNTSSLGPIPILQTIQDLEMHEEDLTNVLSLSGYVLSPLNHWTVHGFALHGALMNIPGRPELDGIPARVVHWVEALPTQQMSWVVIAIMRGVYDVDDYDEAFLVSDNNIDFKRNPETITMDVANGWDTALREEFALAWQRKNSNPTLGVTAKQLYEYWLQP